MRRYFITGTDTDCGKTFVTQKLAEFFPNSVAIKPVASGCERVNNELISSDAQILQQNSSLSMEQINPWRFELAVSPHIAAKHQGASLSARDIATYCTELECDGKDVLFIEGAGGLMVPFNDKETWIDFLIYSRIPVILVVGLKLGCINHALLTKSVLDLHQISCVGWIANCLDSKMLAVEENIQTLKMRLGSPLLATIGFGEAVLTINQQF